MITTSVPWTADDRRALLDELRGLRDDLTTAAAAVNADPDDGLALQREDDAVDRIAGLEALYLARLPTVRLSRCPFTGLTVDLSVDTFGFDGPFWDVDRPLRPLPPQGPPTLTGITGSVRLADEVEDTPHLVVAGPAAPAVVPALLDDESRVVLSELRIGPHTATVACSFRRNSRDREGVAPEWGTRTWWERDAADGLVWRTAELTEDSYAFDLRPLVEVERVLWIAPDDPDAALRLGTDGCPYLDMDGTRSIQRIEGGEVW